MTRRVIATAEVQVASDVTRAEAGLEDLTSAFRRVGNLAEKAAERAEAAFFNASGNIQGSYRSILRESKLLLLSMEQTDDKAAEMARTFREVLTRIQKLGTEDGYQQKAVQALRVYKEIYGVSQLIEKGLHDDARAAELVAEAARNAARETQRIENAALQAELRTHRLGEAFRDVGNDIDIAMAGGLDEVKRDITDTIRRLSDMGDRGHDVSRILERAFDGVLNQFEEDTEGAINALFRLQRAGDKALDELDDDARKAAAALNKVEKEAEQADRALDRIGGASRRLSGDVRGLIGLLGAAGVGYAFQSTTRFGLEMTQQLEKSEAAFLGLTGSVEGAADMLERMVIFARETPYNLGNVTKAAAELLAVGDGFGVTTDNISEYLTTFGNAITITGGSDEQFTRIVRVLGQMSSTGKVLGQDMNQLAQNLPGYDVWQALADGANTSVEELRRLQNIGQLDELLTGNEAVNILVAGMESIPGAAGAMERRMNTLGGALEKFSETAQLALSQGLEPFSEMAQDVLSDPVILNSVEDLSKAFGSLLSSGLEEVAPELDDLAAAGANFLAALEDLAPLLGHAADALGDFLNFISPLVSGFGKIADAALSAGDGIGKMAIGAGLLFAGPLGIAAGSVLLVSGAMDQFASASENAANLARLLAAAQDEVNVAMKGGEEVVLTTAQELALDTAQQLIDMYPELTGVMKTYSVTVTDLFNATEALAQGTTNVTPELQAMFDAINSGDVANWTDAAAQLKQYRDVFATTSQEMAEEAEDLSDRMAIAGIEDIATLEARQEVYETQIKAANQYYEGLVEAQQKALDEAAGISDEWGELDEERTDALKALLADQVDAYQEWEAGINESVQGAALSLSGLAEETENDVDAMIASINEHTIEIAKWKSGIVTAASQLATEFGVSDEAAQEFMGTLGDLGPEFAPAIAEMVADAENGGTQLKDFFDSVTNNSNVMAEDLTSAFDEATGSVPSLAESLAEGTLTIEDVLSALPEAMEAAGVDLEAAAAAIDASDEMGVVGQEAVNGLVTALEAGTSRVRRAAAGLATAAELGAKFGLQISSPSRVMIEIGEFAVEGLIQGMQSMDDEAYASAVQVASLLAGGIEDFFRASDKPQEEARKFAEDVADAVVNELLAEREAVADAAEELAKAAADRLSEAWERVKDRFKTRDLKEAIADAQAELIDAQAELRSAESLAGAGGTSALAAAQARVAKAERLLATAKATDAAADLAAERTLTEFRRQTEDTVNALKDSQSAELEAIEGRIAAANRNLDPVARAAAEAELAAAKERHETEMTALDRRREDEEDALRLRLSNENTIREAAVKAKQDELKAFEKGLADVVKSIEDAVSKLPALRENVSDAQRGTQEAFFDQFEKMLENVDAVSSDLLRSTGLKSGLSATEVNDLISAASAASLADRRAATAGAGVGELLNVLSSGLYTIGANGALGIAAGISGEARSIAVAMQNAVQAAVNAALSTLEIRSPSKLTARVLGGPMAEGIAAGLSATIPEVSYAMAGLLDSVVNGTKLPSTSQLDDRQGSTTLSGGFSGPLVTMPGAIIQDATDADLVAQQVIMALSATGIER